LALASRLAQSLSRPKILVLESGLDHSQTQQVRMVGDWSSGFGSDRDWNFQSVPTPEVNNRTIELSRARGLGGCSTVNGTAMVRGLRQDFDNVCSMSCLVPFGYH
jgi:choline dehydrogenase